MGNLSKQKILESGLVDTMVAAAGGGDSLVGNSGVEFMCVRNEGAGITVTFTAQETNFVNDVSGEIVKVDRVVSVGAGEVAFIGPFARGAFNDVNGNVTVAYSGVATVTVGFFIL